jgi:hypothetical protein
MRWLLVATLAVASAPAARSVPPRVLATVKSPDGRTAIQLLRYHVAADKYGPLLYRVTRDGKDVIRDSPLGLRRADEDFDTETMTLIGGTPPRSIDERYTLPHGKARAHHVIANERTLQLKKPNGARLDIVLRAQNDGVAFRYRFPERTAAAKTVVEERTGFRVPDGSTAWIMPQQEVSQYGPAYEDLYQQIAAAQMPQRPDGWAFPALFKTPDAKWVLITESGLDQSYCGSHLRRAGNHLYQIKFPDPKEGLGVGKVEPESTLPWTLPWRVIIVGDRAGDILESDLVLDVAPASRITNTSWIKPGRAAWSWWSKSDSPRHAADLNAFTDLAAEMGWEYALVDANWDRMLTGTIEDVVAHAKAKNVGLFFWYNSGGPHNDVTESPRDRMFTREARRKEFARLRAWGVKGVKVDFWQSDKQDRIAQYRQLLEDAAEFQLMVNFHGSTIPRGWSREFPNLIGMEAVPGAEQYKFRETYPDAAPSHNTVLPFTRNVAGPMDFTPVTFSDAKYPHRTTNAHELALSVIFETPVQHFADSIESYRAVPDTVKRFLAQVPTAWDETRVLGGEPGTQLTIARRNGEVWYIGAINGRSTAETFAIGLDFLGAGEWTATSIVDGRTDRDFATGPGGRLNPLSLAGLTIPVHAYGGFVMRLEPARQKGNR